MRKSVRMAIIAEKALEDRNHHETVYDLPFPFIADGNERVVWRTETTKRDRLFIEKIGLDISKEQVTENSS